MYICLYMYLHTYVYVYVDMSNIFILLFLYFSLTKPLVSCRRILKQYSAIIAKKISTAINSSVNDHCVKSVKIWRFFWSVFSCSRARKNSVFGHFSCSGFLNQM